jgi:prolyl 4-hydroxylase
MTTPIRLALETGDTPHFIGCWSHVSSQICTDLIDFFESNPAQQLEGRIGAMTINKQSKNSTDMLIEPGDLQKDGYEVFNRCFEQLHQCFQDYCSEWSFLQKSFNDRFHIGPFNLQRYEEGGHFSAIHAERMGIANLSRMFAWMTYLNDVEVGGETEFTHYNLQVKPATGKTLIWPADWTHAHRGNPIPEARKYIITGWLHLAPADF